MQLTALIIGFYPILYTYIYSMKKKGSNEVTKQGWQYCNYCKKETWHTPKLGLVSSNKRLCTRCNTSNEVK